MTEREKSVSLLLRFSVALAFLYPPIAAIADPFSWIGYFPRFILALPIDDFVILHAFGALEAVIGLWILLGKRVFAPSIAATVILGAIVALNINQMDVLFRDISILLAAVALALLHRPRRPLA